MRVLIISEEVWQDGTNGGNVLSNIFSDTGYEFAQIYCSAGQPQNRLCKKYYQMTDSMMIKAMSRHMPVGSKFTVENVEKNKNKDVVTPNKKFYSFFHQHKWGLFYAIRDVLWNISNWKNEQLNDFLNEFDPDIIFAPCYAKIFMQKLTRYVADYTGKKVISYISDDNYTLHQFSLSPYFWINRFFVRYEMRKTFPYYSLVYTMTEVQKKQCEQDFHANMKILRKAVISKEIPNVQPVHTPIRMIYAGGIYLNRWKTLSKIADAIRKENEDGVKIQLDIYTANELNKKVDKKLNDGVSCVVHKSVNQEELKTIYSEGDVALHVESFDLKNRLLTRMSFSTKIVDCLASSCAVMAVCDKMQGGFQYLKQNDAAICVSDEGEIETTIKKIVNDKEYLMMYKEKAVNCCLENFRKDQQDAMIKNDFKIIGETD